MSLSIVQGIPLKDEPGMGSLTIPGYLREVTSRYGKSEAVVMYSHDGVERWSYETLWQKSFEVAKALIACGVGKGSRVGVMMTNRLEYLSAVFGTGLAGGVSVALSTFSTPAELEHLLSASEASVLLFDGRVLKKDFGAVLAELEPQIRTAAAGQLNSAKFPSLRYIVRLDPVTGPNVECDFKATCFETWNGFIAKGHNVPDAAVNVLSTSVTPTDAGGLFFSSGTTSLPKGILHTQQAFAIQWWRWPRVMSVEGHVRSWTGNGFFWSANITMVVGVALSTGGAVIIQPVFDPEEVLTVIQSERINFLMGRPHQWARLQECANWSTTDLSSLHYITNSALMLTHPTVKTDWRLPMTFGTTETMTAATSYDARTSEEQYAGSAGVPLPGNTLKIIDPMTGAVVPRGERGELCIKGPTLMKGYIGKKTEEVLDSEGYYHTGDGGYVDEVGRLYWEGRLTEIIKTGGANISPLEIDAVLVLYPGAKRVQTVGIPHDTLGEMAVGCIVPHDGVQIAEDDLRAFLKEKLASFKIPRRFLILNEEEMAVTGNGKVKSDELRKLAVERLGA